jgi:hypothetical protein
MIWVTLCCATLVGLRCSTNPPQGLYLQFFIFFVTFKWARQASVVHNTRLERLSVDKHSSLLGPFVSYKEKGV